MSSRSRQVLAALIAVTTTVWPAHAKLRPWDVFFANAVAAASTAEARCGLKGESKRVMRFIKRANPNFSTNNKEIVLQILATGVSSDDAALKMGVSVWCQEYLEIRPLP